MSDVPASQLTPVQPRRRPVIGAILAWARDLAFSVVIAFVVIIFIYQPVKVEGNSMLPGLVDQERIFVNKFGYRFGIGSIEHGDLIVFWYPGGPLEILHQARHRASGDTIEIDLGTVILNGRPLREDYVPPSTPIPFPCRRARWTPVSTSCSAITATPPTTAALAGWPRVAASTAKPSSSTGRWPDWVP